MNLPDPALAVVLRQAQWLLDDVARGLPTGEIDASKRGELAGILESLAELLREQSAGVVDVPPE